MVEGEEETRWGGGGEVRNRAKGDGDGSYVKFCGLGGSWNEKGCGRLHLLCGVVQHGRWALRFLSDDWICSRLEELNSFGLGRRRLVGDWEVYDHCKREAEEG